ncbi:MAG: hypothetical protein VCA35_05205, partial [Roseibacillus sp.]
SVGVLECWSVGVLECWSVGVLECWSVGVAGERVAFFVRRLARGNNRWEIQLDAKTGEVLQVAVRRDSPEFVDQWDLPVPLAAPQSPEAEEEHLCLKRPSADDAGGVLAGS